MSEYDPIKAVDMADARDAVIEAAKAYCAGVNGLPGSTADLDLYRAVEALLAAEGEE